MQERYNIVLFTDYTSTVFMPKTIGAYKVASELRRAGFDVQVVGHLHVFTVDEIKSLLVNLINDKTLFVGFSPFFYMNCGVIQDDSSVAESGIAFSEKQIGAMIPHGKQYNQEIVELIKQQNPNCKTVLGGPDASDVEYISDYDYCIVGYADVSVVNLANHLAYGVKLEKSRRSIFKTILIEDAKAETYDFVGTEMQWHDSDIILPGETLPIEISRGCIFRCKFCSYPLNGKKKNDYIKYEDILYKEFLSNYEKYQVTRYLFSDDTFNDSPEKVEMIYRISKKLPFKLEFWAYIRIDLLIAHPDTVPLLFEGGCKGCLFGIETMNEDSAKIVGKGSNRQRIIDMLKHIKETYKDVMLSATFIFGLPKESLASLQKTMDQLLNNEMKLDSWWAYPLMISGVNRSFLSEFDINYKHYGYISKGLIPNRPYIDWQNEHTDFMEVAKLAKDFNLKSYDSLHRTGSPMECFMIAGLGTTLDEARGKPIKTIDWHNISKLKLDRATEYKRRLFEYLQM